MKIIIAQTHVANLEGIKSLMQVELPEKLANTVFCNTVNQVLDAAKGEQGAVIVTGLVFDSDSWGGFAIARRVKEEDPTARVYLYSVMSESCDAIDGYISKRYGTCNSGRHESLIEFIRDL